MAGSTVSRYFRLLFAVALIFALMTPLGAAAQESPEWAVRAETPHDIWSEGGSWSVGTDILVTADDLTSGSGPEFAATVQVEQWGPDPSDVGWYVNTGDFEIAPDHLITVDDGTFVKELTVLDLSIDAVDRAGDTISGTAPADTTFPVHVTDGVSDAGIDVTSDAGGAWLADFAGTFDIRPGTWGSAAIFDAENDATQRSWNIPLPTIEAQPQGDIVQGQQLAIGVAVSIEIDDPSNGEGVDWSDSGTTVPTPWDPSSGYVEFDPGVSGFDVVSGQEITMTAGTITKHLVVAPLAITGIDLAGDLVHGTASSGAQLNVWADTPGSSNRVVTAAPDGEWTADFSVAWEGWDPFDITVGSHVDVWEGDEDGDTTRVYEYVPNPQFSVETPNQIWSHGDGWVADRTVTITVNDGVTDVYTTTAAVTAWGPEPWEKGWGTDTGSFEILPGHVVTVDDGVDIVRTLDVVALDVTDVDEGNETISGTAPPNVWIDANAGDEFENANRRVQADGSGAFTVDFGTPGDEEWEQDTIDLRPGIGGGVQVFDADGDSTHRGWHVAAPHFGVDVIHEELWANDWPLGATLTFTVEDPDTALSPDWEDTMTVVDTTWGQTEAGYRFWGDFDVHGGQVITVTDGAATRELIVSTLEVTNVDPDADAYTGTVDPDVDYDVTHEICAWARDAANDQSWIELCSTPDVDGNWTIDFAGVGEIIPGDHTGAYQYDEDGDQTCYAWFVPPWIYVEIGDDLNPDFPDRVHLDQWAFPVDVTNGTDTVTVVDTDGDGWERIDFDVTPGQTITATGSDGRVKNLYLEELAVDTVTLWNEDPPSTVYGSTTATYTGNVQVTASADYGWWTERWVGAFGGAYEADFASPGNGWREQELGYFGQGGADDIYSGGEIRAAIWDGDNDQVQAVWHATNPRIIIVRGNDRIEAIDFPKGEPLTIEVDDPAFEGIEFSETGLPAANPDKPWETLLVFDLGDYTVPDVATVTALDDTGTALVTTEVIAFTIDVVDPDTDTITGTAPEGTEVLVQADGNWRYPVADDTNTWFADFSEPGTQPGEENPVDIGPGSSGGATLIADGGSATTVLWSLSNAQFRVDPAAEHVFGWEFVPNGSVTITIGAETYGPYPTDGGGSFDTWFDSAVVDITEGTTVSVSDGDTEKTHIVTALGVSAVDAGLDEVSGVATAGSQVHVWVNDADAWRNVEAAIGGTWLADFGEPGDEPDETGVADLGPGSNGGAQQCDADNDCTQVDWRLANPSFSVETPHQVWSHDEGWVEGRTVTLVVDDDGDQTNGILYDDTMLVERWGPEPWEVGWSFDLTDTFEIQPRHYVSVADGVDLSKTLWVEDIETTHVDVDADTISGLAPPFTRVEVNADMDGYGAHRSVDADAGGYWIADFGVPGDEPHEQDVFAIALGTWGAAQVFDEDGDSTHRGWGIEAPPVPSFFVRPDGDELWGHEWHGASEVTITIDDGGDPAITLFTLTAATEDGFFNIYVGDDVDIVPGNHIVVTDGQSTKEHRVASLAVTGVDVDADAVSGIADAGAEVFVGSSWMEDGLDVEGPYRVVEAGPDGVWMADFSAPWADQDTLDIVPGIGGYAEQSDDDGDATHAGWYVEDGENQPPEILTFTGPELPLSYKLEAFASASVIDPDGDEELTVVLDWGDGTVTQPVPVFTDGIGQITDSHFYTEPGIFTLTLTVTDSAGASTAATFEYAVMYDPAGKKILAAVKVVDDTTIMHLGVNVSPDKKTGVPKGHVRFNGDGTGFAEGFDATEIGYLLIFGDWGIVTGTGTIDGGGEYQFLVSVLDQSEEGGIDAFRVILWNDDGIVVDTQPGEDFAALPTTQPTDGDIKVK